MIIRIFILSLILIAMNPHMGYAKKTSTTASQNILELAMQGDLKNTKASLKNIDINSTDDSGTTVLMAASLSGNKQLVEFILSKKADINLKDKQGANALGYAVGAEQGEIADLLIKKGIALETSCGADQPSLLLCAVNVNNGKIIELLISKNKDSLKQVDSEGNSALHLAAQSGTKVVLEILIKSGADQKLKNKKGETPLVLAQQMNHKTAIQLLSGK